MKDILALLTANFTIRVEVDVVLGEIDTSDNVYVDGSFIVFWKVADINGDRKINMIDIGRVAKAFGSYPGHPRWDPAVDINSDSKIDMQDISAVAFTFMSFYVPM